MINWTLLQLAKKIVNWFYAIDPYNGCPEDEAWMETVKLLHGNPQPIVNEFLDAIGYLEEEESDPELVEEGKALLQLIA